MSDGFDPGPRPESALGSSSGFNVGKFLSLTAALAVGAGVGAGAYFGIRAAASSSASTPSEPDDTPAAAQEEPAEKGPKLDIPAGPKLDVPAVDEPSDPNNLRLDVPAPWGAEVKDGGGGGGGGGVTQEVF
jgi:hypothetical protein